MITKKRKPFPGASPAFGASPEAPVKKPKEPKGPRLLWLKNRTVLGILIIAVSLVLAFVVLPIVQIRATAGRTSVVVASTDIPKGTRIEQNMVSVVEVGSHNLPSGLLLDINGAIGMYATDHIFIGDYFTRPKLADIPPYENPYLQELPEGKLAISIDIASLAGGLSGKLRAGDIVSVLAVPSSGTEIVEAIQYPELQYLQVLAVSNNHTRDIDDDLIQKEDIENSERLIVTATLLANELQATRLAGLNRGAALHLALVARGDDAKAQQLLALQEQYQKEKKKETSGAVIPPPTPSGSEEVAP